jgi:hypothetical protein
VPFDVALADIQLDEDVRDRSWRTLKKHSSERAHGVDAAARWRMSSR